VYFYFSGSLSPVIWRNLPLIERNIYVYEVIFLRVAHLRRTRDKYVPLLSAFQVFLQFPNTTATSCHVGVQISTTLFQFLTVNTGITFFFSDLRLIITFLAVFLSFSIQVPGHE
jgi:hypothetical protein